MIFLRTFNLKNANRRDAEVGMETTKKSITTKKVLRSGGEAENIKIIKESLPISYASLLQSYGDPMNLGQAIIDGDPEIDMETIGRRLNKTHKLYLRQTGEVAYRVNMQQIIYDSQGNEKERRELTKALSNVTGDSYVQWSGRKFPKDVVIHKFVFSKKYQLRHVDGATFDYLYAMAKELDELNALMYVGSGSKGTEPLIITQGGEPYHGFLEGKVSGDKYLLILHLSNMEIKAA